VHTNDELQNSISHRNHVLIEVNGPKTKIDINMTLITIPDLLVVVFPTPLGFSLVS